MDGQASRHARRRAQKTSRRSIVSRSACDSTLTNFTSKRGTAGQELAKAAAASHDEFDRGQSLEPRSIKLDEFRRIKAKYDPTAGSVIVCAMAERREVSVQISAEKETSEFPCV